MRDLILESWFHVVVLIKIMGLVCRFSRNFSECHVVIFLSEISLWKERRFDLIQSRLWSKFINPLGLHFFDWRRRRFSSDTEMTSNLAEWLNMFCGEVNNISGFLDAGWGQVGFVCVTLCLNNLESPRTLDIIMFS